MTLSDQHHESSPSMAADPDSDSDLSFELQIQETLNYSCSSSANVDVFRVYFKGLVSDETVMNVGMSFGGIGVAIYDASDRCVSETGFSFLLDNVRSGNQGDVVELKALIEALNAAGDLRLNRVHVFCDSDSVYRYLTGKAKPTNNKIVTLVDLLNITKRNFTSCDAFLVSQNHMKSAYKLAKDAISSEATKWAEDSISGETSVEECTICFESDDSGQMFSVNKCRHRYCFLCMNRHVEAKLLQVGQLPKCPYEKCTSELKIESCKKFLNPELYDIMSLRVNEASIPPAEKVYCPYTNCSALTSKTEVQEYTATSASTSALKTGMRKCVKCNRLLCINCKVAWHYHITCSDYKRSFLVQSSNAAKLKSLATKNRWRECIKCKNLVELARGCYHIYCRCGYEFCYTCGAEWINKKPTCRCPIWDEHIIIDEENRCGNRN